MLSDEYCTVVHIVWKWEMLEIGSGHVGEGDVENQVRTRPVLEAINWIYCVTPNLQYMFTVKQIVWMNSVYSLVLVTYVLSRCVFFCAIHEVGSHT